MEAKGYKQKGIDGVERECHGRYWHMKYEHGIMEDYVIPGSRPDYFITE